jgi:hypothetical protein
MDEEFLAFLIFVGAIIFIFGVMPVIAILIW